MLKVENVFKTYKGKSVLEALSYDFQLGRTYSIVGKSGVGKSTLGRIICRLEDQDKGSVYLNDVLLEDISRQVTMVFQDSLSSMNRKWTIGQVIREPMKNYLDLPKEEEKNRVKALLKEVCLSATDDDKKPHQLSGGQQKRVAIARAISYKPKVIVFDEAISGFDIQTKKDILDMLMALKVKYGLTYIFITHDWDVARYVSDTILELNNKKLKEY